MSRQQKALILTAVGQDFAKNLKVVADHPVAQPAANEVLIRVVATGVNPVDWKRAMWGFLLPPAPIVLGCDVAGVVDAVGSDVKSHKAGDAVWAYTKLTGAATGSFAEYVAVPADMARKFTPEKPLSFAQAAALGVAVTTASDSLHRHLGLRLPGQTSGDQPWVLVYGGAAAVGQAGLQLLRLAGYKNVIAVASGQHASLLQSLGATVLIDYTQGGDIAEKIRAAAGGNLQYAFDAIGGDTADIALSALAAGGKVCTTGMGYKVQRADVQTAKAQVGGEYDLPAARAAWLKCYEALEPLLARGEWKPTPVQEYQGLEQIVQACVDQAQNKVRGAKPVVIISKP